VKRILMPVVAGLLITVVAAQTVVAAPGGGGTTTTFTLSPSQLSFTTPIGAAGLNYVTVTTKTKAIAIANPANSSNPRFIDTTNGTCWTSYGALGQKVPPNTSCTIAVSFYANVLGTFTGTLSVSECLRWHLSASGGIACDKAGTPQTVALTGTSIVGIPDLAVLGIVFDTVGPNGPADFRVDVGNLGLAVVQPGVYFEAWYSDDPVIDFDDTPAATGITTGPIGPTTGVTPVWVNAWVQPSATDQYLIIDLDHGNVIEETDETNNVFPAPLSPH
jgi:hypothetical protein